MASAQSDITSYEKEAGRHFYWLDLIRFLVAFAVMAGHCRGFFFPEYNLLPQDQHTLPVALFYALTRLGYESVLVFFVLSGFLVGGRAIERIREGSFRFRSYAIDRFVRIMLPLLSALLFYLPVCILFGIPINPVTWLGNLLSLQNILVDPVFEPLWSLSYEVWFYILIFGVAALMTSRLKNWRRSAGITILIISLLVFCKLRIVLLAVWLLGGWVYVKCPTLKKSLSNKICMISFFCLIIIGVLLQCTSKSHALDGSGAYLFTGIRDCLTLMFGISCAMFIRTVIEYVPSNHTIIKINRIGSRLAAFSYTLYLVHFPVFILLRKLGAPKFGAFSLASTGLYLLWMSIAMLTAYILYLGFEKNTPAVKKWLKRRFSVKE